MPKKHGYKHFNYRIYNITNNIIFYLPKKHGFIQNCQGFVPSFPTLYHTLLHLYSFANTHCKISSYDLENFHRTTPRTTDSKGRNVFKFNTAPDKRVKLFEEVLEQSWSWSGSRRGQSFAE